MVARPVLPPLGVPSSSSCGALGARLPGGERRPFGQEPKARDQSSRDQPRRKRQGTPAAPSRSSIGALEGGGGALRAALRSPRRSAGRDARRRRPGGGSLRPNCGVPQLEQLQVRQRSMQRALHPAASESSGSMAGASGARGWRLALEHALPRTPGPATTMAETGVPGARTCSGPGALATQHGRCGARCPRAPSAGSPSRGLGCRRGAGRRGRRAARRRRRRSCAGAPSGPARRARLRLPGTRPRGRFDLQGGGAEATRAGAGRGATTSVGVFTHGGGVFSGLRNGIGRG
jgi:hypothetical protein